MPFILNSFFITFQITKILFQEIFTQYFKMRERIPASSMSVLRGILTLYIVAAFGQTNVHGQSVLWGNKVLGYSSEYRPDLYGHAYRAKQILGEPNKLPDFGNSRCAWSPSEAESRNEEWIKVGFEKSVPLKQVAIAENFNPGAIARVYAYDENGKEFLIWDKKPVSIPERGRMLRIFPEQKNIVANAVKVVLQPDLVPGFNQIDAIGISADANPIEARINLSANLLKDSKKENLGKNINSPIQEIAPIISPDGKTLYFTREEQMPNSTNVKSQHIWYSTLNNNRWEKAINIGPPLNNEEFNAVIAISNVGKTLYLLNKYRPNGRMEYGISQSFYTKNGWSFPKDIIVHDLYDTEKSMELAVSPQGNVMVFSIQRRDTEGDKDLYVSFQQKDGTWSEPKRMGDTINTADYEGTPFISADNKTMYFSSRGISGYGGSDLFLSKRLDDTWLNWSKPENLGPSINTSSWDAFFSISATGDYAYFSSNDDPTGMSDIFRIALTPEMKPDAVAIVSGSILEAQTNKPIKADIVADLKKNNEVFTKAEFDPETGEFRFILPLKEIYRITASLKGYFPATEEIDLSAESKFQNITKNLYLQPIKTGQQIRLGNAMFTQSSADVVPSSFSELDRIASTMKDFPAMEILLEGHTDNQGETLKNLKLSEDRVLQVKKYLISKGIEDQRIKTKAWGPAKPIANNLTEQNRQKNRRVEFTILKI